MKAEKKAELQAQQAGTEDKANNEVKDVSDLPEVSNLTAEQQQSIPIYGHGDNDDDSAQPIENKNYKRSQRNLNQEENTNGQISSQQSSKEEQASLDQLIDESEQPLDEDGANSISEAGEIENEAYTIPPLSLLNQPAKQKLHLRQKYKKRDSY